ncbi:MAG: YeeE/YedE family protein [Pseudomonadota bacterium]
METSWIWGFLGGLMIGTAAAFYLLGNGRIMGVSGILGGLIDRTSREQARERLFFLAGLVGMPAVLLSFTDTSAETNVSSNPLLLIAAGLLVGLGTRIGNGCTSGHGVCGISRLSLRGIVATSTFIAAGTLTVLTLRLAGGM